MGNKINEVGSKISEVITPSQEIYDANKMKSQINLFNRFFRLNDRKVGFRLFILDHSMQFDYHNWKKSVFEVVYSEAAGSKEMITDYSETQKPNKNTLKLSVEDLEEVNLIIQPFTVNDSRVTPGGPMEFENDGQSGTMNRQSPTRMSRNSAVFDEEKLCCICCFDDKNMVLPCSHGFCEKCTRQFIIEKDESKCPICRFQMMGNSSAVERQIYTIIDFDDQYEELRHRLIYVIDKSNTKATVKKLGSIIEAFINQNRVSPKRQESNKMQRQLSQS